MFKSLYSKLSLVLLGLFFILGAAALSITQYSAGVYQQEISQKLNSNLAKYIADHANLFDEFGVNRDALKQVFHMLMLVNPSIEIYHLDPRGRILAYSAPPEKVKRTSVDLRPLHQMLKDGSKLPILGDDPRSFKSKKPFSVCRIPEKGPVQGYLYVIIGGELFDNIVDKYWGSYIFRLTALWILASVLFVGAAGLLLFSFLTKRLKSLTADVDEYGKSLGAGAENETIKHQAIVSGRDEIERLSLHFKRMTGLIDSQIEKIKRLDAKRRELIVNISHDLRTPLANLQGYVETLLLKEEQIHPSERRTYLETAIKHCQRLNKLVSELFELAKLESDEVSLRRETFNFAELAHDIIQKFDLAAAKAGVRIEACVPEDLPFVDADIAMIERAMENLLENALRYTPNGGVVRLILEQQGDDITVQVKDSGPGISEKELPFIFDRFHQERNGSEPRGGLSGLGLAITKRIVELHARSISVNSVPGKGATFSFQLPAHAHH